MNTSPSRGRAGASTLRHVNYDVVRVAEKKAFNEGELGKNLSALAQVPSDLHPHFYERFLPGGGDLAAARFRTWHTCARRRRL